MDPFSTFVNNGMRPGNPGNYTPKGWWAGTGATPPVDMPSATAGVSTAPTSGITAGMSTTPSGIFPILQMLAPILQRMQARGKPTGGAAGLGDPRAPMGGSHSVPGAGNFGQGLTGFNAGTGNPYNNLGAPSTNPTSASPLPASSGAGTYTSPPVTAGSPGSVGNPDVGMLTPSTVMPLLQTIMSLFGNQG